MDGIYRSNGRYNGDGNPVIGFAPLILWFFFFFRIFNQGGPDP
jgi:hypothetical protein